MGNINTTNFESAPDTWEIFRKYFKNWVWLLVSLILALVLCYIYLRYATPQYQATAKVQILENTNSGSELNVFNDLELLTNEENPVESEIEIMNARSNFIEVVNRLKTNVKITALGTIKDSDLYGVAPIIVNFTSPDTIVENLKATFFVNILSLEEFSFKTDEDDVAKTIPFGKTFKTAVGDVIITPKLKWFQRYRGQDLKIEIIPVNKIAEDYRSNVIIQPVNKVSDIIYLTYNEPNQVKAIDVLNELIAVYNQNGIADRKAIADKTSSFIDNRIENIYSNLAIADSSEQDFRSTKGLTNIESESNINLNLASQTQQQLSFNRTQANIAQGMKEIVSDGTSYELLPANVGISDPAITNTAAKYNQLISERKRLLKSADVKNPIIVNLNQELDGLKSVMQSSLDGMISNLSMQASGLSQQQARISSRLYSTPQSQRALRDITRKKETTESLYLYLLQKREEAQIAYASSKPKSKILDSAYAPFDFPISPKPLVLYAGSIFLVFLLFISTIFVHNLFDNKVHSRQSLEQMVTEIPVLGELPKIKNPNERTVGKDNRSPLSESFRILSTNLEYIIGQDRSKKNNVMFVTSSVPGEGKTFVASNLAIVLADKKSSVLLIEGDIRNPQVGTFFNKNPKKQETAEKMTSLGLTDYLHVDKWLPKDIINTVEVGSRNIDIIYSGKIPPNPGELIQSDKFGELLAECSKDYDYVIVDTAPMMVVADTLRISKYSDINIYVCKAGSTETKLLEYPIKLQNDGKMSNLCFVVNGVKNSDLGYYGKYGYGY